MAIPSEYMRSIKSLNTVRYISESQLNWSRPAGITPEASRWPLKPCAVFVSSFAKTTRSLPRRKFRTSALRNPLSNTSNGCIGLSSLQATGRRLSQSTSLRLFDHLICPSLPCRIVAKLAWPHSCRYKSCLESTFPLHAEPIGATKTFSKICLRR